MTAHRMFAPSKAVRTEGSLRFSLSLLVLMGTTSCGGPTTATSAVEHVSPGPLRVVEQIRDTQLAKRFAPVPDGFAASKVGFSSIALRRTPTSPFPALATTLPSTANQALSVGPLRAPSAAILLTPLDHQESHAEVDSGRVVYSDVAPSTDLVAASGDTFAELAWVLRDEHAPSTFRFRVDSTSLTRLRPEGDDGLALIDDHGHPWLHFARPFAVDARGTRRNAVLALDGDVLSVELDPHGLSYPIVLDPYVATGVWVLQPTEPTRRSGASMTAMGSTLVVFGGKSDTGLLDDTWLYTGNKWARANVAHRPPVRQGAVMASLGGKAILFGGTGVQTKLDTEAPLLTDTWSFDGTDWTQLSIVGDACASTLANAVTIGSNIVVPVDASDTIGGTAMCLFDGKTWTMQSESGPFDTSQGVLGATATTGVYISALDITWTWTLAGGWVLGPNETDAPPWDIATAMAAPIGGNVTFVSNSGIATWTGTAWSSSSPVAGSGQSPFLPAFPTFAPYNGGLYFLSTEGGGDEPALWSIDSTHVFSLELALDAPDLGDYVSSFGTYGTHAVYVEQQSSETWEWNGSSWTSSTTTAPAGAVGAFADEGKTALFVQPGDTWRWDGAAWTELTTTLSPDISPPMVATVGGTIIGTGDDSTGNLATLVWTGSDWTAGVTMPNASAIAFGPGATTGVLLAVDDSGNPMQLDVSPAGQLSANPATPPLFDQADGITNAMAGVTGGYAALYSEHQSSATTVSLWGGKGWGDVAMSGLPSRSGAFIGSIGGQLVLFSGTDEDGYLVNDLFTFDLSFEDGVTCTDATGCRSGFCAQGVCCNSACDGATESCSLAATRGTCAPVLASCSGDATLLGSDGTTTSCSPYVCSAGACVSKCATSADCLGGFDCDDTSGVCGGIVESHASSGGCGVARQGESSSLAGWLSAVGVAWVSMRRRRVLVRRG